MSHTAWFWAQSLFPCICYVYMICFTFHGIHLTTATLVTHSCTILILTKQVFVMGCWLLIIKIPCCWDCGIRGRFSSRVSYSLLGRPVLMGMFKSFVSLALWLPFRLLIVQKSFNESGVSRVWAKNDGGSPSISNRVEEMSSIHTGKAVIVLKAHIMSLKCQSWCRYL